MSVSRHFPPNTGADAGRGEAPEQMMGSMAESTFRSWRSPASAPMAPHWSAMPQGKRWARRAARRALESPHARQPSPRSCAPARGRGAPFLARAEDRPSPTPASHIVARSWTARECRVSSPFAVDGELLDTSLGEETRDERKMWGYGAVRVRDGQDLPSPRPHERWLSGVAGGGRRGQSDR